MPYPSEIYRLSRAAGLAHQSCQPLVSGRGADIRLKDPADATATYRTHSAVARSARTGRPPQSWSIVCVSPSGLGSDGQRLVHARWWWSHAPGCWVSMAPCPGLEESRYHTGECGRGVVVGVFDHVPRSVMLHQKVGRREVCRTEFGVVSDSVRPLTIHQTSEYEEPVGALDRCPYPLSESGMLMGPNQRAGRYFGTDPEDGVVR
jgi:hypothetical protein